MTVTGNSTDVMGKWAYNLIRVDFFISLVSKCFRSVCSEYFMCHWPFCQRFVDQNRLCQKGVVSFIHKAVTHDREGTVLIQCLEDARCLHQWWIWIIFHIILYPLGRRGLHIFLCIYCMFTMLKLFP